MIKLTLNPESLPLLHTYNQQVVVIGSESSPEADLQLPEKDLLPSHIKIMEEGDHFIVVNLANDPFVTLNGLPFGKKVLHNQDILQVGNTLIRFEGDTLTQGLNHAKLATIIQQAVAQEQKEIPQTDHKLREDLDKLLEGSSIEENLAEEGVDLDSLMKEVDELDYVPEEVPVPESVEIIEDLDDEPEPQKPEDPSAPKKTLEDYYLVEFDDENEGWKEKEQKSIPAEGIAQSTWKFVFALLFALMTLFAIILGVLYVNITDKTEVEEINAARGVSDVAMALTYAQINHIKPQKQNWSDPDFLRNNLAAVLTSDYLSLSNIDTHGSFNNCPYILRIYPSNDFSQFLVIALPAPSFLQWLFPKNAIIVDSKAMEMRKIQDLRALNRLLVTQNTYDGTNAAEISNLVKHGTLIPLSYIANKTADFGFMPPKELAKLHPGAENLIYNAPRYYHFGESFMRKTVNQTKTPSTGGFEVSRLQQEIAAMSRLPKLILYTSEGIELASDALKAIETYVPQKKFLIAQLEFDNDGDYKESHLIMDANLGADDQEIALLDPSETKEGDKPEADHPLVLQLKSLSSSREQMLKSTSSQMISLLNQHTHEYHENFTAQFQQLLEQYQKVDLEQQEVIVQELTNLYKEYSSKPLSELLGYAKAAGVENLITVALKEQTEKIGGQQISNEKIEELMKNIREAKTFLQLELNINEAAKKLTLKYIPDLQQVVTSQNAMRSLVHQKLSEFMLSPETHVALSEFNSTNRILLENILKTSWITEQEEYDFYLTEFDQKAKPSTDL